MRRVLIGVLSLFLVGAVVASGEAAEITFAAYTDGAFNAVPVANPTTPQLVTLGNDLTFTDASFGGTSSGGSLAVTLGSFRLHPQGTENFALPPTTFNLLVTFTIPTGIVGGASNNYSAVLTGIASSASGQCGGNPPCGSVFINFGSGVDFTFVEGNTKGDFRLTVNDLTVNAGQTLFLSGDITGASQTTDTTGGAAAVPEPASMLLLGSGLAAVAARARRRRKA